MADRRVQLEFHTQIQDPVDLRVQYVVGQTILRNAVSQHAPRFGKCFEHRHGISSQSELIRSRNTARTGTDHSNFLWPSFFSQFPGFETLLEGVVPDKPLDLIDTDGAFFFVAIA